MRPGDTWVASFALSGSATGTPTAKFLHNGVQDTGVTPTVSAGADPNEFKVTAAIPASGYAASDVIEYSVTATVSSATQSAVVARAYIDAPATVAANGINFASFAADTKSDGIAQTGSTPTTIAFSASDTIANGLANGTVNRDLKVVSGTGIGQIRSVAAISGASGAKIGTLVATSAGGLNWATVPDNTSAYAWGDSSVVAGTGGGAGSGGGLTLLALQGELDGRNLTSAFTTANTAATVAAAVMAAPIEAGGWTFKNTQKVILKAVAGSVTGNGSATVLVGATLPTPTVGSSTTIQGNMSGTGFADRGSTVITVSAT